jgi:isoquinoline 1-oxidoreductase beta subunit
MNSRAPLIRKPSGPRRLGRRAFIAFAALAGGGLAVAAGTGAWRAWQLGRYRAPAGESEASFNAWVTIDRAGRVAVSVPHQEMGQGVFSLVALLVAEELDCDPSAITARPAPLGLSYSNPLPVLDSLSIKRGEDALGSVAHRTLEAVLRLAGDQMTGGSTSARNCWLAARRAGAGARSALLAAAARRWNVPAERLRTLSSKVVDPVTGQSFGFGELAADAAQEEPRRVEPKPREQYRLIGRGIRRVDSRAKTDGSARFAADIRLPGLRYASVRHAPILGETLASAGWAAGAPPAGADLVRGDQWFAVVATSWWLADRYADGVEARWTDSSATPVNSGSYLQTLRTAAERKEGPEVAVRSDPPDRPVPVRKTLTADYDAAFVAHQTMEPMNCTIRLDQDRCEVWIGTQVPDLVRRTVARVAGLSAAQVLVHPCLIGCGLGRRLETDLATQAVRIALALGRGVPLQVQWRRDEDTRRDMYRPAAAARFEVGLGGRGEIVRLECSLSGPSVAAQYMRRQFGWPLGWMPDRSCHDGVSDVIYDLDELRVRHARIDSPLPIGFWRGVGYGVNSFFVESFIDECAHAAGDDPFQYRRRLLQKQPRALRVLEEVGRLSGWGRPVQTRRGARGGRGVAIVQSFGSIVAQAVEAEVDGTDIRVLRVVAVVDCGLAIDRGGVRAQIASAIVGGLSAALHGQIDAVGGAVRQSNFNDARVLSLRETPRIQVEMIDGSPEIGGVGEVGLPPVAPALANALFAATGKRLRRLPLRIS